MTENQKPATSIEMPPPIIEKGESSQHNDIERLLGTILSLAVEMMNADGGVILLKEHDEFRTIASHNIDSEKASQLTDLSSSVVRKVLEEGAPVLTHDAKADPRFEKAASVILHQITSIICAPMEFNGEIVGVLYLDSRTDRKRFTEDNLNFVGIFTQMAAITINYARHYSDLYTEKQRLQSEAEQPWRLSHIIGKSARMQDVFNLMRRVISSDISVLLEGESGTGKELVARALHYNGPRRDRPFVAQFCGNLAENLLESELFGHKKGSFTGAIADKKGLFEIADAGTFFLDEIADISPTIQAKLLRVIQEGEIRRVGDTESRQVDVRIVSATNKELKSEVDAGRFREDLYYRLNVITIRLPSLRERFGDIPLLVQHFLKYFSERAGVQVKKMTPRAMQALSRYTWPGNVRELENTIERAILLAEGDEITINDLFIPEATKKEHKQMTLKDYERDIVERTLEECGNNKTRTSEVLGVSLRWLHYKLNEWKKNDV
ncbi:sigma-54 interaction domain-containing protein [Calditrichota bacterium]